MGIFLFPADLGLDELVREARLGESNDTPAMNEIVRRFEKTAKGIARRTCSNLNHRDDVTNAARMAVISAVRAHDLTRPGFARYTVLYMVNAARRTSIKLNVQEIAVDTADLSDLMEAACDLSARTDDAWGDGEISSVVRHLPMAQQTLLWKRYVLDQSLAEIAQDNGTSVSAASQRLRTAHLRVGLALTGEARRAA